MNMRCYCYPLKVRSAGSTDGDKAEGTDNENVELEKSNILLMGPTGSGNLLNDWVMSKCVIFNAEYSGISCLYTLFEIISYEWTIERNPI